MRAARRVAQGRAKPIDWLVQDLYSLGEDEGGQEFRNDQADDSEEEREELRRQVRGGRGARTRTGERRGQMHTHDTFAMRWGVDGDLCAVRAVVWGTPCTQVYLWTVWLSYLTLCS